MQRGPWTRSTLDDIKTYMQSNFGHTENGWDESGRRWPEPLLPCIGRWTQLFHSLWLVSHRFQHHHHHSSLARPVNVAATLLGHKAVPCVVKNAMHVYVAVHLHRMGPREFECKSNRMRRDEAGRPARRAYCYVHAYMTLSSRANAISDIYLFMCAGQTQNRR